MFRAKFHSNIKALQLPMPSSFVIVIITNDFVDYNGNPGIEYS